MIKVAISGFSGFCAQNLEKTLKRYEYSVIGIPREVLINPAQIEQFYRINKPEYTINCAAYGNKFTQDNDFDTIQANYLNLINLLEFTKQFNYTGFINFSSSSAGLPYDTFYSATKAGGERIVRAFVNKYDKPVFSVRPASIFGDNDHEDHFIPTVIKSLIKDEEMTLVKEPTHSWIYIEDFCEAIASLMQYTIALKGSIVPISYGKQWSNIQIVKMLEKISGKKLKYKDVEKMREYDNKSWLVDNEIVLKTGWKAKYSIQEGLKKTFDYYSRIW